MIKLVYVIRKRADVSAEEFHDYWLHKHGPPEGQEAGRLLRQDESKFIDFQRSTIFMTEEHLIFDFQGKG